MISISISIFKNSYGHQWADKVLFKRGFENEVHLPCTFSVALFWAFTTKGMNERTNEWAALRANQ